MLAEAATFVIIGIAGVLNPTVMTTGAADVIAAYVASSGVDPEIEQVPTPLVTVTSPVFASTLHAVEIPAE